VLGYGATLNATTGNYAPSGGTNNPIIVPPGSSNVTIGPDGSVSYQNSSGTTVTAGYLSLATFPNEAGLQRDGGSLWSATVASGAETAGQPGTATSGQTIGASIMLVNSVPMSTFDGYQANASTITTADQMMQTAVEMKQ
jgi:flagellar hook protein FlgE